MPRGQRDFGAYSPETYVAGLSDMAELAVRLRSPVIFDRRGKVIDFDDFESPLLRWTVLTLGDGAVALDSTYPRSGSQCVELTSGDGVNEYGQISKGFSPLASRRLGLEFVFSQPSTDTYLDLQIASFDGIGSYLAEIRFDFNAQTMAYLSGLAAYTDIIDTVAFETAAFFHFPIKIVADFSTNHFVRLLFGGREYDLSAYPVFNTGVPGIPRIQFLISHEWRAGAGSDIYVDDVIMTEDEP